jgi:hypothetical protein
MKIFLLIFLLLLIVGGMAALMIFIIKKLDPNQGDKSEDGSSGIAQDFLPFDDIQNGIIILPNYCYRAILECTSLNYDLKTEGERDQIEMSFQRFINSLSFPTSIFLQTKEIDNSSRIESLKKEVQQTLVEFPGISTYAEQYIKDMQTLNTRIGNNQQKKRYIIITYDEASQLGQLSDGEKAAYAAKELQTRCNAISQGLDAVGVRTQRLGTPELIELIYSCYNRDNFSYAGAISSGDAFSLFVDGAEDKFENFPKVGLLDLILGETINQIRQGGIDADRNGQAVLEQLEALRQKYAGYFEEEG